MDKGCIHVYYGDGKGKTTAALGLALRAMGRGKRVTLVQFLKQIPSGEIASLRGLPGARILRGQAGEGFEAGMSDPQRAQTRRIHDKNFAEALEDPGDMLVLDEALDALGLGLLDEAAFRALVADKPPALELVVTGHRPPDWLLEQADYVTEMVCHKHPYQRGLSAREGIEF